MVKGMHVFEQKRHVDQAVDPVEMKRLPETQDKKEGDEPNRRLADAGQRWDPTICGKVEV